MALQEFLDHLNQGFTVKGGLDIHKYMTYLAQEAMKITCELNGVYHTPDGIRALMIELIGKPIDESFSIFPPFYTDCGKNITIGKDVFINSGCHFQDQGGIIIGNGALIGHNVVLATLNHEVAPDKRGDVHLAPIII